MLRYSLPDIVKKGDPSLLMNVWDNIVENAIKYNKHNGEILSVRADRSRSNSIEGSGLGLAIAHSIVKLHDGYIQIKSVNGEGTTVMIQLPIM